jgi:glutamyl-tRNA synthetase
MSDQSSVINDAQTRPIVTRFAPSPTGYLHIGGSRTALFNWLFARGKGGKFLLRIENTDRERSTQEASNAILRSLTWLGLDWDGEVISQIDRKDRHAEVAYEMVACGAAYKCFCTQGEIETLREAAKARGENTMFQSPWRDASPATHPDAPFVIRMRAPRGGKLIVEDAVQGQVSFGNDQLDDMICLRSDATPTYMLADVVDDHDMGVTHVIRGDDHLNNASRQSMIYQAMGWEIPVWAHSPLIHGPDGKKLSKRHGAVSVEDYQSMGYTAAGMRNYLARLGWSHGNDEFFTTAQAKEWFELKGIGRGAARLDFKKLENISGQHISATEDAALLSEFEAFLKISGRTALTDFKRNLMLEAMYCLKDRAKTFIELNEKAEFVLTSRPIIPDEKAVQGLTSVSIGILSELTSQLHNVKWNKEELERILTLSAANHGVGFGKLATPLRSALAGRTVTPSVYDMMLILGRNETLARINDICSFTPQD